MMGHNETRGCGCIIQHTRVYVCERHAKLPEDIRDRISELTSKVISEEIDEVVTLKTRELQLQVEALRNKIEENKVVDCAIINVQTEALRKELAESNRLISEALNWAIEENGKAVDNCEKAIDDGEWARHEGKRLAFAAVINKLSTAERPKSIRQIAEAHGMKIGPGEESPEIPQGPYPEEGGIQKPTEKRKCENVHTPWSQSLPCVKDAGHGGEHEDVTGCHWR